MYKKLYTKMTDTTRKIFVYVISTVLIITSFILPPTGEIDPSVLLAVGLLIGGYEWLFGHSVKSVNIDKTGIHIETYKIDE